MADLTDLDWSAEKKRKALDALRPMEPRLRELQARAREIIPAIRGEVGRLAHELED